MPVQPDVGRPAHRLPGHEALRVLVADDLEANRKLALLMLRALGHSCDSVAGGKEAIEAAQRNDYDVILMDVQMPGMDGFAATRAIRALPGGARPKIVGVTASAMPSDRDSCLAAGMDTYLAKPFTPATLADLIQRIARGPHEPGAADTSNPFGLPPPAENAPDADQPIDWTRLDSLRPYDADGSLVREASMAFVRDGPTYLAAMFDALSADDREALAAAAHALKGAAANVGARNLEAACREVETLAHAGQLPRAAKAVSDCAGDLEKAVRALEK